MQQIGLADLLAAAEHAQFALAANGCVEQGAGLDRARAVNAQQCLLGALLDQLGHQFVARSLAGGGWNRLLADHPRLDRGAGRKLRRIKAGQQLGILCVDLLYDCHQLGLGHRLDHHAGSGRKRLVAAGRQGGGAAHVLLDDLQQQIELAACIRFGAALHDIRVSLIAAQNLQCVNWTQ